MTCDNCGRGGARIIRVGLTYAEGSDLLVIENVPKVSCHRCGAGYFTAETLYEIERINLHRKSIAVARPVEVAHFT